MSHDLQKINLIGNIESEVSTLSDGSISFNLRATRKVRGKEESILFEIRSFEGVGKFALTLHKGDRVFIEGALCSRSEEGSFGLTSHYITAFDIVSIGVIRKPKPNTAYSFDDLP